MRPVGSRFDDGAILITNQASAITSTLGTNPQHAKGRNVGRIMIVVRRTVIPPPETLFTAMAVAISRRWVNVRQAVANASTIGKVSIGCRLVFTTHYTEALSIDI